MDDAVAKTEAVAMPSPQFWTLIAALGGSTSDDAFDSLASALAGRTIDDLVAFAARLSLVVHALDTRARHTWYTANDPMGLGFVSDDVFLYARLDTICAGESVWLEAIREGTLPWGSVDPTLGAGELLLSAAPNAADAQGGWEEFGAKYAERVLVSYETGSNTDGW